VAILRLATHAQLAALTIGRDGELSEPSSARAARRLLARLADAGLLARFERRIGGVRAGSAGFVYYLGPVGQRLVAYWDSHGVTRGRVRSEPGPRFVRHRLMVSQLYVDVNVASRAGTLDLVAVDVEPDCWEVYRGRRGQDVVLKPDAVVRIRESAGEGRFLVEVDLATESRAVIERKLRTYDEYFASGPRDGGRACVVLVAPTQARAAFLDRVRAERAPRSRDRFHVGTLEGVVALLHSIGLEPDGRA
jgi:hypothetical protein